MTKTKRRPVPTEKHGIAPVRKRGKSDTDAPVSGAGRGTGIPAPGAGRGTGILAPGAGRGRGIPAAGRRRRAAVSAQDGPDGTVPADPMRLGGPPAEGTRTADRAVRSGAGDHLRSVVRGDGTTRFGTPPSPVDDHARRVWRHAFGLAVRRRFEPASPLAEISRVVAAAVRSDEQAGLTVLEAEMLVRAELGEAVPVDEMAPAVRDGVHLLLFAFLVDELALGDGELETLVTKAELAAAR